MRVRAEAPEYMPQARAERLIALGRFILAGFSLLAIYLEPSTPANYQETTYALLLGYTVYAAAILAIRWRSPLLPTRQRLASHLVDLLLFTIFIYLTEGPASPFFLYFIFSLFCATLRFRWPGIVATGVAAVVIYSALTAGAYLIDHHVEWSRAFVRVAYLAVITALLAYLGLYQEQLRSELAALAAWPREVPNDIDAVLRRSLAHAAEILHAPRLLFVWEEAEEPWVYSAVWAPQSFAIERAAPGIYDLPPLRPSVVIARSAGAALVLDAEKRSVAEEEFDPVGDVLRRELSIRSVIAVAFKTGDIEGRLFVLDAGNPTVDDLVLAHICGRFLHASLEQLFFVQQVWRTASAEERLRIARDLHDGVIQSLSGIALQVQSARVDAARGDRSVADRLLQIERMLEREQRELRDVVRELRPADPARDGTAELHARLRQAEERFAIEWGMTVGVNDALPEPLSADMALEIYRIVNESLANAARHGGASRADVKIAAAGDHVRIRVSDNGRGFGFAGLRDLAALERFGEGPKTLKERITRLGGTLVVESGPAGATIDASFPLHAGARA